MRAELYSREAEQQVLGECLQNPGTIPDILATGLQSADFYAETHRRLWDLLLARLDAGQPIDPLVIAEWMHKANRAEEFGGFGYLTSLGDVLTGFPEYWAVQVRDLALMRRVQEAGGKLQALPQRHAEIGASGVLEEAEKLLSTIAGSAAPAATISGRQAAERAQTRRQRRAEAKVKGEPLGVASGILPVDRKIGCLLRKELSILAARPGMGKTSLCLEITRQACRRGEGVGIFSLEMPEEQLTDKLLCLEGKIPTESLQREELTRIQEGAWIAASEALYGWPLLIDDTGSHTITQIRSIARRWKLRLPRLRLIIVDYIQLVRGHGDSGEERIASVSRGLKELAKELDVAVLGIAQLNRDCEDRRDKRPLPSDLRGSGQLEQDAGLIAFLYRHHRYEPENASPDEAEFIVAKARFGEEGKVKLRFEGATQRFSDPDEVQYDGGYL